MRILDLQSLRDAIKEELNRFTESDDTIDGFIQRAEARIKRLQATIDRATTETVPMTPGESEVDFVALATNVEIVKPLSAAIIGTDDGTGFEDGTNLRDRRQFRITHKADIEMLIGSSNAVSATPSHCAVFKNRLFVAPLPDREYVVSLVADFFTNFDFTDGADVTELLIRAPDLYFYGALMETAPFFKDDQRLAMWTQLYDRARGELDLQTERFLFPATPIQPVPKAIGDFSNLEQF